MDRLILVRHGRTTGNHQQRYIATTDLELDDVGRGQAQLIGRVLSKAEVDGVYSSPARRSLATAEGIVAELSRRHAISVDERLAELGMGAFEGCTAEEIAANGLAETFRSWRQGWPVQYPDGAEDFRHAESRVRAFYRDIASQHLLGTVVVVAHSHLLRILIATEILGGNAADHRRLRLDNGQCAVVEWEFGVPRLVALNTGDCISAFDPPPVIAQPRHTPGRE
ncbi:MAG: hypothetical protein QOI95_1115 [Acidimicrobiaceae bacterium]